MQLNKLMLSLVYTNFFFFFFYFGPPYFQILVLSLIIIVGELGVLIVYASRVVDPRPNKKTRWFDVPCPDHILKRKKARKGKWRPNWEVVSFIHWGELMKFITADNLDWGWMTSETAEEKIKPINPTEEPYEMAHNPINGHLGIN